MRFALLAAPIMAFAAAVVGAGDAAAQSRNGRLRPDLLVRQFERIAFSSEFGGQYRSGRLIRWEGPITVRVTGHVTERIRTEVERQLAELRQLSGLAIDFLPAGGEGAAAAMTIEFSTSRGGTKFDPKAPCRTLIWETGFVVRRVQIYISPYPDELRRHCIAEELTQSLGLADDSSLLRDSIFNDASNRQRLSSWDGMMIRILYDPRLKAGMRRAEAMPLVRRIVAEQFGRAGTTSSRPR